MHLVPFNTGDNLPRMRAFAFVDQLNYEGLGMWRIVENKQPRLFFVSWHSPKIHPLALLAPMNALVLSKGLASFQIPREGIAYRSGSSSLLPGLYFLHCYKELFSLSSSNNPATQLLLILELVDLSRRHTQNFRRLCYATGFDDASWRRVRVSTTAIR
jgi:hypothetical protein